MNLAHKIHRYLFTCLLPFSFIFGATNFASSEETYVFERMWPVLQQPWYFDAATGIAVDDNGNIYIANVNVNSRIQKFTSNGHFISQWANELSPSDIEIGCDGLIYGIFYGNHSVRIFTLDGQFIAKWGSYLQILRSWC